MDLVLIVLSSANYKIYIYKVKDGYVSESMHTIFKKIYFGTLALTILVLLLPSISASTIGGTYGIPVWIDTDPACGNKDTDDVDDCWALLLAFKSPELDIKGISTVFGNADGSKTYNTAKSVIQRFYNDKKIKIVMPNIYRGADKKIDLETIINTDATDAIYKALKKEKLTITALGPVTNIAALIMKHPDIASNIREIIAVAGNRSGKRRFFSGKSKIMHFHDLNFRKDPLAFDIVLKKGIPLTLIPFEVATKVTMSSNDVYTVSSKGGSLEWLAYKSQGWIKFWKKGFGMDGFHPFDCLAISYAVKSSMYKCESIPARIRWRYSRFMNRNELEVSYDLKNEPRVNYCFDIVPQMKNELVNRLMGESE